MLIKEVNFILGRGNQFTGDEVITLVLPSNEGTKVQG